ncbi:TIGR04222 domain-containing membrane protein [Streptacidiphilus sp. MAP5-52]|uniref:TIGR04222 domain-containing membrane protein n=1 Tax=Streptacidiphilus sp. MAP5-52 TaxID=3156267 RepID=UPI003516A296
MAYVFLIPACLLAMLSALRLCRLVATIDPAVNGTSTPGGSPETGSEELSDDEHAPDLFDAAYLAGGPERVVELTLVRMVAKGVLHLAHTGWTSVARPHPQNELEAAVLTAIGPEGQCRTDELRREVAHGAAVREIADRLTRRGLAVAPGTRDTLAQAVTGVRWSLVATLGLFAAALGAAGARDLTGARIGLAALAAWFTLPLVLSAGTLLMARIEVYPVTPWAAPPGQDLLRGLRAGTRRARAHRAHSRSADQTLALILRGPNALREPYLRAALKPSRAL